MRPGQLVQAQLPAEFVRRHLPPCPLDVLAAVLLGYEYVLGRGRDWQFGGQPVSSGVTLPHIASVRPRASGGRAA